VSVYYRRAPQHPCPAGLKECGAVLHGVAEHAAALGGDPNRIAVAGDSAGANLAAVVAHFARDSAGPTLAFQLLWYPVIAADLSLPSYTENADAPVLDRDVIDAFLSWYLPGIDISDPKALPATLAPSNNKDFSGLAPAYIGSAEHDPLRDDAALYAALLNGAGVPAVLSNEPTLVHGYVSFALLIPAAAEATNRGLAALKAALQ
jgi:acetyl esterase